MQPSSSLNRHLRLGLALPLHNLILTPYPRWSGPNPLVQTNSDSIHWVDLSIERCLEVAVRTQALLDEAAPASPCPERQTLEPPNIAVVEEHVSYCNDPLVDLVRVTSQDDAFRDDAVHRRWKRGTRTDKAECGLG